MHHENGNPLRRIPPRSHALFGTNLSNPRSALMYIFSLYYGNVYYANIVEICPFVSSMFVVNNFLFRILRYL